MKLFRRASGGDLVEVKILIQRGVPVNTKNRCGQTALYFACQKGHINVVGYLLDNGALVNLGAKPLIAAVRNDHYECVKLLLRHHATVHCTNRKRESPIAVAIQKRNYSIIFLLLRYGAVPPASLGDHDISLQLLKHAQVEHVETIQKLVDQKVIQMTSMDVFLAAFGFAFKCGSVELAESMLSNHNYSTIDHLDPNAVYYGAKYNWPEILSNLFEKGQTDGQTPLCAACETGHETVVTLLLNNGADPNVVDKTYSSPLYLVCERGETKIAKLLLSHGANPNMEATDKYPIHAACSGQHYDLLKLLLEHKTDVAVRDKRGKTALHYAVGSGYHHSANACLQLLLDGGADVNVMSKDGETPFSVACSKGLTSAVAQMLEHGAKMDGISGKKPPLIGACRDKHVSLVQLLLSNGANPDTKEAREYQYPALPLHIAAADDSSEIVNLLLKHGSNVDITDAHGNTALHYCIKHYHPRATATQYSDAIKGTINAKSVLDILLENGADVNISNNSGETPLYMAVSRGLHDVVSKMLEKYNGNPNTTSQGETSLVTACEQCNVELVDVLLKNGADPNQTSVRPSKCRLPLFVAVEQGNSDKIITLLIKAGANVDGCHQLLLDGGADVNVMSKDGETPFSVACSKGLTSAVAQMLEHGAKVDGISGKKPPLISACRDKNVSLVQLLLSNGANPDIKEASEHQYRSALPLHIAAADDSSEIVNLLLKHGSNVDITDAHGNTALHYFIKHYQPRATTTQYSDAIKGTIDAKSVLDILLENGADVNILNNYYGETPLYMAVSRGLHDVVSKMLEKYGGNPNTSSQGETSLVTACEQRNVKLVDVLLKNGADPNQASVTHWYPHSKYSLPLFVAVKKGNSDKIITLLIKAGANVNAIDQEGKTALCIEIMKNHYLYRFCANKLSTIHLLVEHGADLNVLMPDGRSLLYLKQWVYNIAETKGRGQQTYFIELLQLAVKHGVILSDSCHLAQNASHPSQRLLKDLATFDGRHEFIVDLFRAGAGLQLLAKCCHSVATRPWEVKSIRLCQAAILSGYTPSVAEIVDLQFAAASEHVDGDGGLLSQLVNWLYEDTQRVPSLIRQCRVVIRRQLSTAVQHRSILTSINQLPLPDIVKMYLQFEGTLTEVDLSVNKELCSEEPSSENWEPLVYREHAVYLRNYERDRQFNLSRLRAPLFEFDDITYPTVYRYRVNRLFSSPGYVLDILKPYLHHTVIGDPLVYSDHTNDNAACRRQHSRSRAVIRHPLVPAYRNHRVRCRRIACRRHT